MLNERIDFSNYSKEDLIDALENVDDEEYPETALEILTLLESKMLTEEGPIESRYENNGLAELVFYGAGHIYGTWLQSLNEDMQWKIKRIRDLRASRSGESTVD